MKDRPPRRWSRHDRIDDPSRAVAPGRYSGAEAEFDSGVRGRVSGVPPRWPPLFALAGLALGDRADQRVAPIAAPKWGQRQLQAMRIRAGHLALGAGGDDPSPHPGVS
jgi:hypothetical protein